MNISSKLISIPNTDNKLKIVKNNKDLRLNSLIYGLQTEYETKPRLYMCAYGEKHTPFKYSKTDKYVILKTPERLKDKINR